MSSKIVSLNTLESGKSTAGGGSSMTSATAVETPTSAIPLVRLTHGRHHADSVCEDGDGKSASDADEDGHMEDEKKAGLEVDMDAYRGELDPELAYVHAHRRERSVGVSSGIGEERRSNASGR